MKLVLFGFGVIFLIFIGLIVYTRMLTQKNINISQVTVSSSNITFNVESLFPNFKIKSVDSNLFDLVFKKSGYQANSGLAQFDSIARVYPKKVNIIFASMGNADPTAIKGITKSMGKVVEGYLSTYDNVNATLTYYVYIDPALFAGKSMSNIELTWHEAIIHLFYFAILQENGIFNPDSYLNFQKMLGTYTGDKLLIILSTS